MILSPACLRELTSLPLVPLQVKRSFERDRYVVPDVARRATLFRLVLLAIDGHSHPLAWFD